MRPPRGLQEMIDACTKHGNAYYLAQAKLNDFCQQHYGQEPGDVDADSIIDAVFGGCGAAAGMKAAEFDEIMRDLTNRECLFSGGYYCCPKNKSRAQPYRCPACPIQSGVTPTRQDGDQAETEGGERS